MDIPLVVNQDLTPVLRRILFCILMIGGNTVVEVY